MNKIKTIGLIILIGGFLVSGFGSYVGAKCNYAFLFPACETGPYGYTVGIAGLVIVMAGIFLLTYVKR